MPLRSVRRNAFAGLVSASLLCAASAFAQTAAPLLPSITAFRFDQADLPAHKEVKDYLFKKARYAGGVRLIVGLKTDFVAEHGLSQTARNAQRTRIADAQKAFVQQALQRQGKELKRFSTLPFVVVEGNETFLQSLFALPNIASIQEDMLHYPSLAESVPLIGGDKAWAAGKTGAGQTVAIVDSGVDSTHPFLAGKVVAEACYSTNSTSSKSVCPNGQNEQTGPGAGRECQISGCLHGTHVAGIAAGKGTNFSGVAKDANVIAVQVFTSLNSGCSSPPCLSAYTSDIMKGLEYVYSLRNTYKIAAVNMSLGGGSYYSNCDSDALKTVIDNLRAAGIATIIASGNESRTYAIASPACISTAISVGATTKTDTVASYSNSANILTMLAPGSAINSSVPRGDFASLNGTSMATPHVTGAFAVLRSAQPSASVDTLKSAVVTTGKPVKDTRNYITKPRLDLNAALVKLDGGGAVTTTTTTSTTTTTTTTGGGTCFTASNSAHVSAGRAYVSNLWYAKAKGSNQSMGLNNAYTTTKLRKTGTDYYVIDSTCP